MPSRRLLKRLSKRLHELAELRLSASSSCLAKETHTRRKQFVTTGRRILNEERPAYLACPAALPDDSATT
jgi:hypothetical protein